MADSRAGGQDSTPTQREAVATRAAVRGLIAAMAMTGMRSVTAELDWIREAPPDAIAEETAAGLLMRLPQQRREVAKQLAHWAYGGVGGAVFGILPRSLQHRRWAGPAYGLAAWLVFEVGLAPILGLRHAQERRPLERLILAVDHALYGVVVASSPWPQTR